MEKDDFFKKNEWGNGSALKPKSSESQLKG